MVSRLADDFEALRARVIVGLISSFREGRMIQGAIRSALAACDRVLVFEGPVGDAEPRGEASDLTGPELLVRWGAWESDAAKRTEMVQDAQHRWGGAELWGLWLDGDEVLLWPEHLRTWIDRLEADAGGMALRLVELDGSVAKNSGKVIRLDLIEEYLHSSYQVKLRTSPIPVALPNVLDYLPPWTPADDPRWGRLPHATLAAPDPASDLPGLAFTVGGGRPPLQGEPHILHLAPLRSPDRQVRRLSDVEAEFFENDPLVRAVEG